jgi:RNA 3'-phosphate cyclase
MIELDGSMGEGGGQILRTALALSAVTGKPFRIVRIRANRTKPGLAPQHAKAVEAVAVLCGGKAEPAPKPGLAEMTFTPGSIRAGAFGFDIGTAGSVCLVLQALLPAAARAPGPVEFRLSGGTDVPWAPPVDYVRRLLRPALAEMGLKFALEVERRGHYPKGGGRVRVRVEPARLRAARFVGGRREPVEGVSHASNLPGVAGRQASAARRVLEGASVEARIEVEEGRGSGPGSGIVLGSGLKGAGALGERGKPAERVGEEAARELLAALRSPAAVDRHLGDQLVPFLALAEGASEMTVPESTSHLRTNIGVAERFAGRAFKVEPRGEVARISVD